jgi:hypothetical protein
MGVEEAHRIKRAPSEPLSDGLTTLQIYGCELGDVRNLGSLAEF